MKYTSVKKESEIKLDGIRVTFDKVDSAIKMVYLTDKSGNVVRFSNPYSSVEMSVPAPPETEKRYTVTADVPGLGEIKKTFTEESEARAAAREANHSASLGNPATISEEDVVVEEPKDDGIPF